MLIWIQDLKGNKQKYWAHHRIGKEIGTQVAL